MTEREIAAVVAGYLLGSVPFGLIVARLCGAPDLRAVGSGNIGATNVARAAGGAAGVLVGVLDAAKGAAGIAVAERLAASAGALAVVGVAAIAGHVFPVWLGFRGGKGVATACGVFLMLAPAATAVAIAAFALTVALTRYVSLGSLVAAVLLPPAAFFTRSGATTVAAACAAAIMILVSHRANVARLLAGTERRLDSALSGEPR